MNTAVPRRQRQRGQSMVEFCIVVPLFLFMLLLIFQLVLIYRAKSTLDYCRSQRCLQHPERAQPDPADVE